MTKKIGKKKSRRRTKPKKISVMISGMPSVGKTTAANSISRSFHLKHLAGGDMLKRIAVSRGYKPLGADWWDSPKGTEFLSERERNPDFDKEVDRILNEEVSNGGVVVTSYTMPWLSKNGLKFWFKASQRTRAKRLAGRDSIDLGSALKIITKRDAQNRKLYKSLYGIDFGKDLSVFNYVIDTDNLSANQVAQIACRLVGEYVKSSRTRRLHTQKYLARS